MSLSSASHPISSHRSSQNQDPIKVTGKEQSLVIPSVPDGGLAPLPGVHNYQIFRATRARPELADDLGWTYNHHIDMACWHGKLYVGWESGRRDEDIYPAHEIYSTSDDGIHWSKPAELFPTGIATPLRMYFYRASSGRMLAIAGLRLDTAKTVEKRKGPLVVREIFANHSLGPVFRLQPQSEVPGVATPLPAYTTSLDSEFVSACRLLLNDNVFLEQQDYGRLLGTRAMPWHETKSWPKTPFDPDDIDAFGKGMSFYQRADGTLVGIGKKGWVITSSDGGHTWSQPVIPKTLLTDFAKVWGQRLPDETYALVYNPKKHDRYPLVIVTGTDGTTFGDMRVVHGEVPIQRYGGDRRDHGPAYNRGISMWANDHSRADHALWIAYSVNEEDIWISRIPVPVITDPPKTNGNDIAVADDGIPLSRWNIYVPRWTTVAPEELPGSPVKCLRLEDRDPFDYASATHLFPESDEATVTFQVMPGQAAMGELDIELWAPLHDQRPVRLVFGSDSKIHAVSGQKDEVIGSYLTNRWNTVRIDADAQHHKFSVSLDGQSVLQSAEFAEKTDSLSRLVFRTGPYRPSVTEDHIEPDVQKDQPSSPVLFRIRSVRIHAEGQVPPQNHDPDHAE
jgi:hypothetical protein